jgi:hypothetical protein
MAIVQVSRITQRKGLQEDLPQPLAGAEMGWAIDQRRLFIGNGTLADGAPIVGNTEILTEFSDILGYTTAYTYRGDAAGYSVQTGASSGSPVSQSLQQRLDSYAIVTDFGAVGDGVTDDTAAINRALFQLYCVQSNPQIRRSLFFPAGVYKVSDTLLVPPYARLYGEGANSSIIQFTVLTWQTGVNYSSGVLVKQEDPPTVFNFYRSVAPVPAEVLGSPVLLTDTNYWLPTNLSEYVMQTADSLQQTGVNIGVGGSTSPRNVEVSGMAIQTSESGSHDILLIDRAQQISFNGVNFSGALNESQLTSALANLGCVRFSSTPALTCSQVVFDQCRFENASFAINTDQATRGVTVSNSWLTNLHQGIVLGDATPVDGGPSGFRIMHSSFDRVHSEGVVIDNCSLNATGYNTFYDVANSFNGPTNPSASIISINANNNISVGDMFARTDDQTLLGSGYPRVRIFNNASTSVPESIAFTNGKSMQLGSYSRLSGRQVGILDGATDLTLFTVDTDLTVANGGFTSFVVDYTLYRDTAATKAVRLGSLTVVSSPGNDSAGEDVVFVDNYTENESCDFVFVVTENSSDQVTVSYTTGATGFAGILYYSLRYLA